MEPHIQQHPSHPRGAAVENEYRIPDTFTDEEVALIAVEFYPTVEQQQHDTENEKQKQHEGLVVANSHIVPNPRAVMIKFLKEKVLSASRFTHFNDFTYAHATITDGTMLRSQRLLQ